MNIDGINTRPASTVAEVKGTCEDLSFAALAVVKDLIPDYAFYASTPAHAMAEPDKPRPRNCCIDRDRPSGRSYMVMCACLFSLPPWWNRRYIGPPRSSMPIVDHRSRTVDAERLYDLNPFSFTAATRSELRKTSRSDVPGQGMPR